MNRSVTTSAIHTVLLYKIVFKTRFVLCIVATLALAILLQPLDFIYASEETETPVVKVVEAAPEPVAEPEPEPEIVPEEMEEAVDIKETEGQEANGEANESATGTGDIQDEVVDDTDASPSATDSDSEPLDNIDGGATVLPVNSSSTDASNQDDEPSVENLGLQTGSSTAPVTNDSGATSTLSTNTVPTDSTTTEANSSSGSSGGGQQTPDTDDTAATTTSTTTTEASTPVATSSATSSSESESPVNQPDDASPTEALPAAIVMDETDSVDQNTSQENNNSSSEESFASSSEESATTTITPVPNIIDASVTNVSNRLQFSNNECVNVGGGAFYCYKQVEGVRFAENELIAKKDQDGDREIYMTINGEELQITDNDRDDLGPEFDQTSNSVVWYSMRGGRYQIMQYDFDTQEEVQITSMKNNSTEPSIEGDNIVWQYWDGKDWEIMLFDGSSTTVITDNITHDLSPSIRGKQVIWTTHNGSGEQVAQVYDVDTGEVMTIADSDGGTVQNPRFVLVYDTKYENGDVVTKGFDPETGAVLPLRAEPVELPDQIPESDSTGETRALLQQKSGKEDSADDLLEPQSVDDEPSPVYDDNGTSPLDVQASTTPDGTIDLQATTTEAFELTEYDLPVLPYDHATSTQVDNSTSTVNLVE